MLARTLCSSQRCALSSAHIHCPVTLPRVDPVRLRIPSSVDTKEAPSGAGPLNFAGTPDAPGLRIVPTSWPLQSTISSRLGTPLPTGTTSTSSPGVAESHCGDGDGSVGRTALWLGAAEPSHPTSATAVSVAAVVRTLRIRPAQLHTLSALIPA